MKSINMDHVERLSRGKKSGAKIGSKTVGHYLKPYERDTFKRALLKGYMVVHKKDRVNLWHIWEKACLAKKIPFLILVKNPNDFSGAVYREEKLVYSGPLNQAKQFIQSILK
jgi:hypothetical protein